MNQLQKAKQILHSRFPHTEQLYVLVLISIFVIRVIPHMMVPLYSIGPGMGDAQVRIAMVMRERYVPSSGHWLPLPFILLNIVLSLYRNEQLAPRLLAIFVSLCLLVVLYRFTKQVTHRASIGFIACILFLFTPLFMNFATVPLTEPLFALLFCGALLSLLQRNTLLGAILYGASTAVRIDSWVVFPALLLYLYVARIPRWKKGVSLIISASFLLYWLCQNYLIQGDLFYMIRNKIELAYLGRAHVTSLADVQTSIGFPNMFTAMTVWIGKFFSYGSTIIVLALLSIFSKERKNMIYFFVAAFGFLAMTIILTMVGIIEWYPDQYIYLPVLSLLTPGACGYRWICERFQKGLPSVIPAIIIVSVGIWIGMILWREDFALKIYHEHITKPALSTFMQRFPTQTFVFTIHPTAYPFDRDYIAYHAGFAYSNAVNVPDIAFFCREQSHGESFITMVGVKQDVQDSCRTATIEYEDTEYFVWKK